MRSTEIPNPKSQIPNKSQIPIFKIQNKNVLNIWILVIGYYLDIGIWKLVLPRYARHDFLEDDQVDRFQV